MVVSDWIWLVVIAVAVLASSSFEASPNIVAVRMTAWLPAVVPSLSTMTRSGWNPT